MTPTKADLSRRIKQAPSTWLCANKHRYTTPVFQRECAHGRCSADVVCVAGPWKGREE